ncbi:MAG: hypothetical protein QOG43_3177 [Actinomycetota bacterium]|nr:hypothetical protein [Actinomycetota bacterium]
MAIRRRGDHWIWVGGPVPPGSDAITVWSVISVRRAAADSPRLLRHEEEHVRQWHALGPIGFLRQYLGAYVKGRVHGFGHRAAYRMIPLEIEAEDAARRFMESGGAGEGAGGGGGGALP